MAICKIVSVIN